MVCDPDRDLEHDLTLRVVDVIFGPIEEWLEFDDGSRCCDGLEGLEKLEFHIPPTKGALSRSPRPQADLTYSSTKPPLP